MSTFEARYSGRCGVCDYCSRPDGTPHGAAFRAHVIDGMTVPPGGPGDPFWQGAQWAYGQVREALDSEGTR